VTKGLDSLFKKGEGSTRQGERTQSYQRNLYLKNDGDMARIRFLTEAEDMETVHSHAIKYTSGGKTMYSERYCVGPNNGCKYCADGLKYTSKWNAWVYVYETYSMVPSKGSEAMQSADGKTTAYVTKVNQVMLLRQGRGKDDYIITKLKNLRQKYGTLLDRDYDYTMSKGKDSRSYDFMPNDPTQFSIRAEAPYEVEAAAKAYPYTPEDTKKEVVKASLQPVEQPKTELLSKSDPLPLKSRQLYQSLFGKKEDK